MKIGYIAVGSELLWENKIETNKSALALALSNLGLEIEREIIIKDKIEDLIEALKFFKNFNFIIISGGLGPTKDDITRDGLSKYFKVPLIFNEKLFIKFKKNYEKKGIKLKEVAKNQFFIPEGSEILMNKRGTAPGIFIKNKNLRLFAFPGVPEEFNFMVKEYLIPCLKKKKLKKIYKRNYNLAGTFESHVEEKLTSFYKKFPGEKLTILASAGIVSLSIKSTDKKIFMKMDREIKELFKDELFSLDDKSLNETIFELLKKNKKKISLSESCTGGGLTYELVKIPGISKYLIGSVVVYSNEAKEKILGVSGKTLKKFGAVSAETAMEMAEKVREKFKSDIGISITGIAGPEGGTLQKPVGTLFIGLSKKEFTKAQRFQFSGSRHRIQRFSINFALNLLRKVLL